MLQCSTLLMILFQGISDEIEQIKWDNNDAWNISDKIFTIDTKTMHCGV